MSYGCLPMTIKGIQSKKEVQTDRVVNINKKLTSLLLLGLIVLIAASCNRNLASLTDPGDENEIFQVLNDQESSWNRGDIDAFMTGYWNNEELTFTGARGMTKGWKQTLANYKKGYPDKSAMGILKFTVIKTQVLAQDCYSMIGRYELKRVKDKPSGYFSLIWKKIDGKWLIVSDHTSASPTE